MGVVVVCVAVPHHRQHDIVEPLAIAAFVAMIVFRDETVEWVAKNTEAALVFVWKVCTDAVNGRRSSIRAVATPTKR